MRLRIPRLARIPQRIKADVVLKMRRTFMVIVPAGLALALIWTGLMLLRHRSQQTACLNNLRQIHSAIESCAIANRWRHGDPIEIDKLVKYIKGSALPECPCHGNYIISPTPELPRCSVHGNLLHGTQWRWETNKGQPET